MPIVHTQAKDRMLVSAMPKVVQSLTQTNRIISQLLHAYLDRQVFTQVPTYLVVLKKGPWGFYQYRGFYQKYNFFLTLVGKLLEKSNYQKGHSNGENRVSWHVLKRHICIEKGGAGRRPILIKIKIISQCYYYVCVGLKIIRE